MLGLGMHDSPTNVGITLPVGQMAVGHSAALCNTRQNTDTGCREDRSAACPTAICPTGNVIPTSVLLPPLGTPSGILVERKYPRKTISLSRKIISLCQNFPYIKIYTPLCWKIGTLVES